MTINETLSAKEFLEDVCMETFGLSLKEMDEKEKWKEMESEDILDFMRAYVKLNK